jgi:hypothetical protein
MLKIARTAFEVLNINQVTLLHVFCRFQNYEKESDEMFVDIVLDHLLTGQALVYWLGIGYHLGPTL